LLDAAFDLLVEQKDREAEEHDANNPRHQQPWWRGFNSGHGPPIAP